jgi:hypothetical protein
VIFPLGLSHDNFSHLLCCMDKEREALQLHPRSATELFPVLHPFQSWQPIMLPDTWITVYSLVWSTMPLEPVETYKHCFLLF